MKKVLIGILLTAVQLTSGSSTASAQRGGGTLLETPNDTRDVNQPASPTDIPFDGGLTLVAAAGVAYVARKGYNKQKAK